MKLMPGTSQGTPIQVPYAIETKHQAAASYWLIRFRAVSQNITSPAGETRDSMMHF